VGRLPIGSYPTFIAVNRTVSCRPSSRQKASWRMAATAEQVAPRPSHGRTPEASAWRA